MIPFPLFIVVLVLGGMCVAMVANVVRSPIFVSLLEPHSTWLAAHASVMGNTVSVVLMLGIIALPPLLMRRFQDGELEQANEVMVRAALSVAYGLLTVLWLLSVGAVIGMGFFWAKHAFSF